MWSETRQTGEQRDAVTLDYFAGAAAAFALVAFSGLLGAAGAEALPPDAGVEDDVVDEGLLLVVESLLAADL